MEQHRQGEKLPMVKFREMIRLHELGYNQSEIARSCVVARATVQDYLRRATAKGLSYDQLSQMSDSEAQVLLGKGKPPQAATTTVDFERVHRELQRKGVTLALLWQEGLLRFKISVNQCFGLFSRTRLFRLRSTDGHSDNANKLLC